MKKFFGVLVVGLMAIVPAVSSAATLTVAPNTTLAGYYATVTKAADRLVALQNDNGSWDWVVTNATGPTNATYYNIAGVTAQALIDAYRATGQYKYLAAAQKAGDYIVTQATGLDSNNMASGRQNAYNILFLESLAAVSTTTNSYASTASSTLDTIMNHTNYWTNIGSICSTAGCTADQLLAAYENYRDASTTFDGVVAWDLLPFVQAAKDAGNVTYAQALEQDIANYMNDVASTTSVADYSLGLSSAVRAANIVGADGSSFLSKLTAVQGASGEFGTANDGQVQATAYAFMALNAVGDSHAAAAASFIGSNFTYSSPTLVNGWSETGGAGEVSEVDAEAVHALSSLFSTGTFYSIQDAVNAANPGDTISLNSDATTSAAVVIDRSLTIDGNGHTLHSDFAKTDNSNNAGIMVEHSDVTIKNLTVDGANGTNLHGINIYLSTGVTLDGVTVSHNKAGVIVNGSVVTANNITTSGNAWGGIDVDQGSGVTATTTFTVTGTSTHSETGPDIWIDDVTKTGVSVVDSGSQYATTMNGNTRSYNLPVAVTTSAGSAVSVTSTSTAPINVTVPANVTDSKIDLTSLASSSAVTTPVAITVDSDSVDFSIPTGTTITSATAWDGSIDLPHVTTQTVTPSVASNETATVALAISVGSDSAALTFDKPVKLVFAGQAGKRIGFSHGTSALTEITATCAADQATNDQLAAGAECKTTDGADLIVWTKHFTTFATYSVTTNATPVTSPISARSGGRSSGGGGGGSAPVVVASAAPVSAPVVGRVLGASAFRFTSTLKRGMSSDAVSELQDKLHAEGYLSVASTGYFGPATFAAVKAYQVAKGLPSTGLVGPLTMAKLNEGQDEAAPAAPAATTTPASVSSAKAFIEVLIAAGVIPADKAASARALVSTN